MAGGPLPRPDASRHLVARAAGHAVGVPGTGRAPCRASGRPDRACGPDRRGRLGRVAGMVLRRAAGRPGGALLMPALGQPRGGRRGPRGRRRCQCDRRTCCDIVAWARTEPRDRTPAWAADLARVPRHGVRLHHRARRTDGWLRPRVHDRQPVRRRRAGGAAGAHSPPPVLGARRRRRPALHCLCRFDRPVPPRRGRRKGLPALAGRAGLRHMPPGDDAGAPHS
mmetsp:Transcript_39085/g.91562  ORF Transcript_39085/g.91562 Transcript_39085/m.91562 type:complete len:224 (-) Transcript_39085:241-912(-)